MKLTGLHILLTYQCNFECDHCFVWGSPWQSGTLTLNQLEDIYRQAKEVGTVTSVYFEGGEPFLYYPILVKAVQLGKEHGFNLGIVSNSYWATTKEDALEWLKPFVGMLGVMYRGRAAEKLVGKASLKPWTEFDECPYEDLREPGRIHLGPLGNLHICQGICIGNLFEKPLKEICAAYDPDEHPITGPLLVGGPAELVRRYNLPHNDNYADACHLCYTARVALRERYPSLLGPDQVYGLYAD
jgi:hypothetical protein